MPDKGHSWGKTIWSHASLSFKKPTRNFVEVISVVSSLQRSQGKTSPTGNTPQALRAAVGTSGASRNPLAKDAPVASPVARLHGRYGALDVDGFLLGVEGVAKLVLVEVHGSGSVQFISGCLALS